MAGPRHDLAVDFHCHAALRNFQLPEQRFQRCGSRDFARLTIDDDFKPVVGRSGCHALDCYCPRLRTFHFPTSRISVACVTPALVAALAQGKLNAATSPELASTT